MRNKTPIVLALALFAVFVFAGYQLLALQYTTGAGYPPYSTLSSTPLGMKALHDALARVPGVDASRRLQSLERLGEGAGTTLVIAGATLTPDAKRVMDELNGFIETGGRVVVAYMTVTTTSEEDLALLEGDMEALERLQDDETESGGSDETKPKPEDEDGGDTLPPFAQTVSVEEAWGFDFGLRKGRGSGEEFKQAVRTAELAALPPTVPWIATLTFTNLAPPWARIYTCDYAPVIVEREFGEGSIVMLADSYLLTNEGLREDRAPALMAWLVGPSARVVFLESHLGVAERPGLMALIRRYGLHGFLFTFIVVALLYIWKHAFSLAPPRDREAEAAGETGGRAAGAGLVHLLRRSVPPREVLATAYREWQHSLSLNSGVAQRSSDTVRALVESEAGGRSNSAEVVARYQRIVNTIEERKRAL